jgi:hypothetical protein
MFKDRTNSTIFLNSLFYFLCAYLILFLISRIGTAVSASVFGIPIRIYYNHIDYIVRSYDWTADAVTVIFCSGPFISLVTGLVLLIVFSLVATETGMLRILLMWLIILSIASFFGDVIIGALMNQGFGYVIMYLFIMDTGRVILTLFGGILLFASGLFLTRSMLFVANIYFIDIREIEKTKFMLFQYAFPYIAGFIIIQLFELPRMNWFESGIRLCGLIFLVPAISRSVSMPDMYFEEDQPEFGISWKTAVTAFFLLIIYRIVFGIGLRIIL